MTACKGSISALPAEDVLREAASVASTLTSVAFHGTVQVEQQKDMVAQGDFNVEGRMSDAGANIALAIDGTLTMGGDAPVVANGQFQVILAGKQNTFLRFDNLTVSPDGAFIQQAMLNTLIGTWWRLPGSGSTVTIASITPDPALIRAQSQVVTVTKDNGITTLDGADVYHFGVTVDPEKLRTYLKQLAEERQEPYDEETVEAFIEQTVMTGQLWIDANDYYLRKVEWEAIQQEDGKTVGHFTLALTFTDQNEAEAVIPPAESQEFSPFQFLQAGQPTTTPLQELPAGLDTQNLTEEQQEALIEMLLQKSVPPPTE